MKTLTETFKYRIVSTANEAHFLTVRTPVSLRSCNGSVWKDYAEAFRLLMMENIGDSETWLKAYIYDMDGTQLGSIYYYGPINGPLACFIDVAVQSDFPA